MYATFLNAAKSFFVKVAVYLQKWCPIDDELLVNVEWLDVNKRQQKTFMAVEFLSVIFPISFGMLMLIGKPSSSRHTRCCQMMLFLSL